MSRIRTLKPDHFMDEALSEVSIAAHFLLSGLWCLADREGRLEDRPRYIKAQVFPYRDVDVEPLLEELARVRRIVRYAVDGVGYVEVCNWTRDQRPHVREAPSTFPGSAEAQPRQCAAPTKAVNQPASIPATSPPSPLGSSSGNRDLGSGKGLHEQGNPGKPKPLNAAFHERLSEAHMRRRGSVLPHDARLGDAQHRALLNLAEASGFTGQAGEDEVVRRFQHMLQRADRQFEPGRHKGTTLQELLRSECWGANSKPPEPERKGPATPGMSGHDWNTLPPDTERMMQPEEPF